MAFALKCDSARSSTFRLVWPCTSLLLGWFPVHGRHSLYYRLDRAPFGFLSEVWP